MVTLNNKTPKRPVITKASTCSGTTNALLIIDRIKDLRENTDFVSTLLENLIGYAIITVDFDGNIISFNEGAYKIYGYTPEEVIGKQTIDIFFTPEFILNGKLQQIVNELLDNGRLLWEGEKVRKNGASFPAHALFTLTKDKSGKVVGFILLVEDLSERKLTEKRLLDSMSNFYTVINDSIDAIIISNQQGIIRYVNPAAESLFNRNRKVFIGELFGFPIASSKITEIEILRTHGEITIAEMRTGVTTWYDEIAHFTTIHDITTQKHLESQKGLSLNVLERLNIGGNQKDMIRDLIMLIKNFSGLEAVGIRLQDGDDYPYYDTEGFIKGHIQKENRLCAINKAGQTIRDTQGKPIMECMCGNVICGRFDPDQLFFTKGGSFWTNNSTELLATTTVADRQVRTRNVCNKEGYESVALIPFKTGSSVVGLLQLNDTRRNRFTLELIEFYEGISESIRTILERQEAFDTQKMLAQRLQAQVDELEAFSYGIAHDLRSPLVSIEGFSRLLREDIRDQKVENVQDDIRLLESGVKRMQGFLSDTLEYSRSGQMIKRTRDVSISEIAREVITELSEQINAIGAMVSIAETFPCIYADRCRIKQVLNNLIQNSIKYRDKSVPLKIEIGHYLSKKETIFFVKDNGLGIDQCEAEKIFDLFYRGTAEGEGSGIGLTVVKKAIEAHGGRVWVQQDQKEKGTTMCFTLPQQIGLTKEETNGKN
jgi:PAS domain S-box-containing protein